MVEFSFVVNEVWSGLACVVLCFYQGKDERMEVVELICVHVKMRDVVSEVKGKCCT